MNERKNDWDPLPPANTETGFVPTPVASPMSEKVFLQQLFLLQQDIASCPMLDAHAASRREAWSSRLSDLLQRRAAANDAMQDRVKAMDDAAEMLWVVLSNVSGSDWSQQTPEWQAAAARWRDHYFAVREKRA